MKLKNLLFVIPVFLLWSCSKKGCTDPTATNFDSEAEKDDGSCEYAPVVTYSTPDTYVFTDADGNNTVSYGGQTARMDMLSRNEELQERILKSQEYDLVVIDESHRMKAGYQSQRGAFLLNIAVEEAAFFSAPCLTATTAD